MAVNVPAELGGSDAGVVSYSLAMTEIARACPSTAVTMAVTNMVGEVIAAFGSEEQRQRYNPALAGGGLGAFALSEVGAGSDPGAMKTTATREGDGWVLNGTKQWISHADGADVLVVWARTGGAGSRGISCFLVEPGAAGLSVDKHEDKMGLRASHTCGLVLEDVRVPGGALLGEEGGGFRIAMMALDGGRIGIASQAMGIAEAAYEQARRHLGQAEAPGAEQAAGFALADARVALDAATLLTMRAAALKESGAPFTREASMAKVFASEQSYHICETALRLLGPRGWRAAERIERCLRDVRVAMIYEGTSEIQRHVIARTILRA
jgi:alkylation response protein AidB-like acyl-CoA dehydrogenase